MSLVSTLCDRAEQEPRAPLFTFVTEDLPPDRWKTLTCGALWEEARRVGRVLRDHGIGAGDRVGMIVDNQPWFFRVWFGIAVVGAVPVPFNTALRGSSLRALIEQAELRALATARSLADLNLAPEDLTAGCVLAVPGEAPDPAGARLDELVEAADPVLVEPHDPVPGELATIMYTSGTTGLSKGVMWTHEFLEQMSASARQVLGHGPDDVPFVTLPLFHSQALSVACFTALSVGGRAVVAPRFSARRYWSQVADSGGTLAYMIGSIPQILLRQPPSDAEQEHGLRLAEVIPPPRGRYEEFETRFSVPMTELYGMTDIGIPLGIPHGQRHPGSCGRVLDGWECRVVDDDDRPVPDGEVGELVVRPTLPYVMPLGYWRDPGATVAVWRNLWFHTGDHLRRDEHGWFTFVDRKRDAIRRAGENVSSLEVEQVLIGHDRVLDAAVFGVASDLGEEEVMAVVVPVPGTEIDTAELVNHCEQDLPYFAVPRYVELASELPRTENEKVRKSLLRERGVTDSTTDTGARGRAALAHRER